MSTDDWRAVDWPRKQVERIDRKVGAIQEQIGDSGHEFFVEGENTLVEAVTALDKKTRHLETVIGRGALKLEVKENPRRIEGTSITGRLNQMDRTLATLERRVVPCEDSILDNARAIDTVSEELAGTDRSVMALNDRISLLERRFERDTEPWETWAERQFDKMGSVLNKLNNHHEIDVPEYEKEMERIRGRMMDYRDELAGIRQVLGKMEERLSLSEDRRGNVYGRLKGIEDALKDIQSSYVPELAFEDLIGRIRTLEQQAVEMKAAMLSYGVPMHGSFRVGGHPRTEEAFDPRPMAERNGFAEPEFSPPIGGRSIPRAEDMRVEKENARRLDQQKLRIVGAAAARQEAYTRGLSAGAAKALDNAERRVRSYMDNHFSTASIEGVIQALYGPQAQMPTVEGP